LIPASSHGRRKESPTSILDTSILSIDYVARHVAAAGKNWWQVAFLIGIAIGAFFSMRLFPHLAPRNARSRDSSFHSREGRFRNAAQRWSAVLAAPAYGRDDADRPQYGLMGRRSMAIWGWRQLPYWPSIVLLDQRQMTRFARRCQFLIHINADDRAPW